MCQVQGKVPTKCLLGQVELRELWGKMSMKISNLIAYSFC